MVGEGAASGQVKSATRTLDIIEFVVANDRPLMAQEISDALSIPVSSLSYLLGTLADRGYLLREGRRYRAGPGLERLQTRKAEFTLAERVAPLVRTLRVKLNETSSFFVRAGSNAEAIVTETSEHALRYAVNIGARVPLHALAAGKAILSYLCEEELEEYFETAQLAPLTQHTIVDPARLRAELDEVRASGIAHSREEFSVGIAAIATPVRSAGEGIGALSVAVPLPRYDDTMERDAVLLLRKTAELIA